MIGQRALAARLRPTVRALVAVVLVGLVSAGCGESVEDAAEQPALSESPPAEATTEEPPAEAPPAPTPKRPAFDGNIADHGDYDFAPLEKWLADVGRRDAAALTQKCWTFAPEAVRAMYVDSDIEAINRLLNSGPPEGAQYGPGWGGQDAPLRVYVYWKELQSPYACPIVDGTTIADYSKAQATHIIKRLIGRASGKPVRDSDTPENYFLGCERFDLEGWDERTIYPRVRGTRITGVERGDSGIGWLVRTSGPDFLVREMFGGCIESIR